MEVQSVKRQGFRLWRLTLKSIGVLSLLMVLLVYVARLSDNYVCLQMGQNVGFNGPGVGLLDITRDVYVTDTRANNSFFGLQSPDRTLVAAPLFNAQTRSQDLVIRPNTGVGTPITLQGNFQGGGYFGRGVARLQWSPDSSRLAYLWNDRDQNLSLSVVTAKGDTRQTVSLGRADPQQYATQQAFLLDGWSGDSQYLTIDQQTQAAETEAIWSTTQLDEAQAVFKAGAWSPQGHQYAGLQTNADGNDEVVIWSPEKQVQTGYVLAADQTLQLIDWSPDGHYFALQSHVDCAATDDCSQRWSYDIFNSDGTLVEGGIPGKIWAGASSVATAVWSADSQNWVFLQPSSQNSLELDLVAWHTADKLFKTVATNLDNSLTPNMFYSSSLRRLSGGAALASTYNQPSGKRVLIPTDHDGKIRIELADLDGGNRSVLVDGADEILSPQQANNTSQQFWSQDGQLVTIVWATGDGSNRRVHLTWAKADGSDRHEINDDIQSIDRVELMRPGVDSSQKWLTYLAMRNGVYSIELAELDTGKHYPLLTGVKAGDSWSISPSPDGQIIGVVLQSYTTTAFQNELYLVSLDGKDQRQISSDMLGAPSWSPDGSTISFIEQDATNSISSVSLTRVDGTPIKTIPLVSDQQQARVRYNRNQATIYKWTTCS